ncbi:hypothetical protein RB595_004151 [Gaeumannomyces hyphopodioides]
MSANKLDKSLDEILSNQRRTSGRKVGAARRSTGGRPATTAPVGGIQKNARPTRNAAAKPAPSKPASAPGTSKIVVSNMPKDVTEAHIKYFGKSIGTVKKVEISYGPGGVSRGIATIIFAQADAASKAFQDLNGILIDQRPIKVEVVVSSADQIPAPKTLSQRITHNQPKAQPKSAASDKRGSNVGVNGTAANGAKGTKKAAANPRRAKNARPAKKTAEELDSEMADYFQGGENNATEAANTTAPAAAANGDAAMEEDIL